MRVERCTNLWMQLQVIRTQLKYYDLLAELSNSFFLTVYDLMSHKFLAPMMVPGMGFKL